MEGFLSNCSQMKIIVTTDSGMLSGHDIPEAITVYTQDKRAFHRGSSFGEIAKIFGRQRRHKDVLSMMREWKRQRTIPASFIIRSTLSSLLIFKKSE